MAITPTYPGVYIQEIPSGVRTVTGVATSITAFIGRAERGPVNEPITINNYGDFERIFGGLWVDSTLGYAVNDFYQNGGSQAIIVRLFNDAGQAVADAAADAAEQDGASVDNVKSAADEEAGTYVGQPGQDAADAVAGAVDTAADNNSNGVSDVVSAANEAVPLTKALIAVETDAVAKAATDAVSGDNPDEVAAAAEDKAGEYTSGTPAREAADIVAQAAQDEANRTPSNSPVDDPTAQSVADAAQAAVSGAVDTANQDSVLYLEAANEGSWGNSLQARVDYNVRDDDETLFNLTIRDGSTGQVEQFRNVSVDPSNSLRVDRVLFNQSQLVRVQDPLPTGRPAAHADPQAGENVWHDNDPATNSKVDDSGSANNGGNLTSDDLLGDQASKTGIYALENVDLFNLLCIPPYLDSGNVDNSVVNSAATYCEARRAMLIIDPPVSWTSKDTAKTGISTITTSKNAAIFFPRLRKANPLRDNQIETFAPCGAVAGVFSRTDAQRGVWKAPAGLDATLNGVSGLSVPLTDAENGELNPLGINCLRALPAAGRVVWGARTRQGDDRLASEWKYIPVRRLALYIEESLYRGTQWAVFEPNDEPLWAQIRLNLNSFMQGLFRQGAFQGSSANSAYFVKCDSETTTQYDIDQGIVNVVVGFAPLKPAEFVIISLQQMAGQG